MVSAIANTSATPLIPSGTASALPDLWGGNGFSFKDLFDIINPLQQLPGVGTIYRAITGDTLSVGARLLGGGLFGGPIGLAAAGVDSAIQVASGQDVGSHLLALFEDANRNASGSSATRLQSDSDGWFSLYSSLMPDASASVDFSSQSKAATRYVAAQKLIPS